MKKALSIFLSLVICLGLCACGNSQKEAEKAEEAEKKHIFEISKQAYDNISVAYEITDRFASDLYNAWHMAVFEEDSLMFRGTSKLAKNLSISEHQLKEAGAYAYAKENRMNWDTMSEEEKSKLYDIADIWFGTNAAGYCLTLVTTAYKLNGKADEANEALAVAKELMKEISQDYSDYEHYPSLKGYYTATSSFLDFCQNPEGAFGQFTDTSNSYRNEIRDYINDLAFVFEE